MKTQLAVLSQFNKDLFITPYDNFGNNKPTGGGFWTSTLTEDGKSDWVDFAEKEEFYSPSKQSQLNFFEIEVKENVRVLTIDSKEDYEKALNEYGLDISNNSRLLMTSSNSMTGRTVILDYEKMKEDFDALSVTRQGRRENFYEFFGWDCESTVWFNMDCFESVKLVENKFKDVM